MPVKVERRRRGALRDVATLRRTFKDPESFARINGQPAIALEVSKRTGENIIDTIERVRDGRREPDSATGRDGVDRHLQPGQVRATSAPCSRDLQNNVLSAILLVMIVVVGRARHALRRPGRRRHPGSFLTGILVLAALGLTVNIVVLFGLILAVGMLVDGAIVVTEYADRKMTEGLDRAGRLCASPPSAWRGRSSPRPRPRWPPSCRCCSGPAWSASS